MKSLIQLAELAKYEAIERHNDAILAAHPECPRYCYTCQTWLNSAKEAAAHPGHSIH